MHISDSASPLSDASSGSRTTRPEQLSSVPPQVPTDDVTDDTDDVRLGPGAPRPLSLVLLSEVILRYMIRVRLR